MPKCILKSIFDVIKGKESAIVDMDIEFPSEKKLPVMAIKLNPEQITDAVIKEAIKDGDDYFMMAGGTRQEMEAERERIAIKSKDGVGYRFRQEIQRCNNPSP